MGYAKTSLAYIKKNFYLYAMLAVIPSILLGVYSRPFNTALFWLDYDDVKINNFGNMLKLVLKPDIYIRGYPFIVTSFAIVLASSMWFNTMEQHLKVGRLSLSRPLIGVNYTILPVLITLVVLSVILVLLKIIVASIAFVIHEWLGGMDSPVFATFLIAVVAIVLVLLFIGLFLSLVIWIPGLIMSGYSFRDMLVYCLRLIQNKFFQIYSCIILPLIVTLIVLVLLSLMHLPLSLTIFFNSIIYMFWFMYLHSYSMLVYFDLTNVERHDE